MIGRTNAVVGSSGGGGTAGEFMCTVIDYDGTVLKQEFLDAGDTFELPSAPDRTSEGLVFDGWSSPVDIVNNKVTVEDDDIIIGAMYDTISGYSELIVEVGDGAEITLYSKITGEKDWGDGTVDSLQKHTYTNGGKYVITLKGNFTALDKPITDTYTMYVLKEVRVSGSVTTLNSNCFQSLKISKLMISKKVTTLGLQYVFASLTNIKAIVLPNSITELTGYCFNCDTSGNKYEYIVIPNSVTKISIYTFYYTNVKNLVLPKTIVGTISQFSGGYNSCFSKMTYLRKLNIPSFMKQVSLNDLNCLEVLNFASDIERLSLENVSLKELTIPDTVQTVNISGLDLTSIVVPSNVRLYQIRYCYSLCSVVFKGDISSEGIPAYGFASNYNCLKYDFSHCTRVPTLANTNAFNNINSSAKILVPASLEEEWKAADNWSTYANKIVGV